MMKINNYTFSQMIKSNRLLILLMVVVLATALKGIGLNPIRPLKLNKGASTKYMFFINPETQILSKAKLKVTFPNQFDKTAIASSLTCQASSLSYSWRTVTCSYSAGAVTIDLGTIKNEQTSVLISNPTNPSTFEMSSFFQLCLMVDTMTTVCDKTFGKVVFAPAPVFNNPAPTASYPVAKSLNTRVVGQSSTYEFQFSLSKSYTSGNTVRITFPEGYQTTSTPICQMKGTYNQIITTFVWPDKRTVECQNISKTLYLNESIKIVGILNPNYAGTFGNSATGFTIELLQGFTTIVLQELNVQMTVTILAGTLKGSITQANNFITADVVYTIYLNLLNSLTSSNFILIRFDNTWLLYENMCSVISGITMSPKTSLSCKNYTQSSYVYLNVSGFVSASVSNQLVFNIKVRSPSLQNIYSVGIQTANSNGILDEMTTTVSLNSTEGDYKMLSINAIVAQSNVPVSGTGPLELTFFLNYDLPQTNVLTSGKFQLKIYPQIPLPPPLINGVLKCYFFNTIPAQSCTWDTSNPLYTFVTINTPLEYNFQYSQIPVTITTEGAVNSSRIGITIADIVTRYRFQLQAFQHNSTSIPTEVYFSQFIAAPIDLPITYYSLTHEVNEKTHLRFEFTSPYNFTNPLTDDLRIQIEFLSGGAWATDLGFLPDHIYKNFPCVFSDDSTQTLPPQYNADVSCDLYTFLTGPHASLTNSTSRGPYIIVSGFTNMMFISSQVRLEFGGILIGSSTNLKANVRFSLIQQTPDMLSKYVELYFNELSLFTTASQSISSATTGAITASISNPQINAVSNRTISYTAPSNFFAVVYEFDMISTPSFPNQFVECTVAQIHVTANWCTYLGYPVNQIVEYSQTGTFATSVSSILNLTNGVYSGTFNALTRVFSSTSLTILKQSFTMTYTPYTISSISFYNSDSTVYKGNQHYYTLDFYPIRSTPDDGFIRLILANYGKFSSSPFCYSTHLTPLVTQLGILCTVESSTSFKIYNIKGLTAGNLVRIKLRIYSDLTSGSTFRPQITVQTHYYVSADPSIVDQYNTYSLNSNINNYHNASNEFKINNPRISDQPARAGYIGKFEIEFSPSADLLSATSIKMTLNNHAWNGGIWTTPNSVTSDPLVCMINLIRVACTYTLSPMVVTMDVSPAGITNGQNNVITIDTEYLRYNGIKHPSQGGQYNLYLEFLDSGSSIIQKQSLYTRILAPQLRNFYVNSSVNDIGVENMFHVQFELGSTMVNAFNHASMYSRIFIEFPTLDSLGNRLFADNLGGYQKTGQFVGCAFNTWDNYYIGAASGYRIMCRLIRSQAPGDPVKVQILHHAAFSTSWRYMKVWIAKVFNPDIAVTSVPISIRIEHVEVSTNNIYELYYDTFDLFMNTQNVGTLSHVSYDCKAFTSQIILNSGPVNHPGLIRIFPRSIGGFSTLYGYYFVLDATDDFKPMDLEVMYSSNQCSGSYYFWCLMFPDINYLVIYSNSDSYYARFNVLFAQAISQVETNLVAKVWSQWRYKGTHTIRMSPTCWKQIESTPTSVSITATTGNSYFYENRRKMQVVVQFTLEEISRGDGSVQIKFPSSVPRVYPHCRSMTNLGSALSLKGSTNNGEVGCMVQNNRSWVITNYNDMTVGDVVKIVGFIDLPGSNGYLGTGEIIVYNNTHPTDIHANGFIIDYYTNSNFFISLYNEGAMNVDSQITMDETLPLRTGYVGPLRFKFSLASNLNGPNQGKIQVRVPGTSTMAVPGGFAYSSTVKYVCQIVDILSYEETGCIITDVTSDTISATPNILFTMVTSSTLTANTLYKLVISTHSGVQPEGLTFPTIAGTYRVDFNFDTTGSTGYAIHNHQYMEVYGTKFTYILFHQFCSIPGGRNLIWIKITPTTTIQTFQQIVIEIPTKSSAGATLFSDDLGLGLTDGSIIPIDILDAPFANGFMSCRLFHGNRNYYQPAKIVCGGLTGTVTSSQLLWFSIVLINPGLPSGEAKVSIPFFIYTVEQGTTYKTNFDVVENAVYLRSDYASRNQVANPASQNGRLQTSGMYLDMISRNSYTTDSSSYYIIFFGFPLRNNGVISNGCTNTGGTVYGDAIYHANHWAIVCKTDVNNLGVPGNGYVSRNLRINGFFTPFYYLSSSQQWMLTYTYHFSTRYTTVGTITDGYPNESPKLSTNPSITITSVHQTTRYAGARDDYIFTFTYTSSSTEDLSFVKKIALIFPSGIDYIFVESDCMEAPGSQVEIASCVMDPSTNVIWITPVEKSSYTSDMSVSIITRNLAIRNPVSSTTTNANQFSVKYYTWQNISMPSLSPTSNNYHCYLLINNFPSSSITHSSNPSGYNEPNFDYIQYPHQRYYLDTPFSSVVHRAPFEMEFYPAVTFAGQSGSNYHYIKVVYPSTFSDANMVKIRDLQVFRPVCYLNNQRIRECSIDTAANAITLSFLFGLSTSSKYHLKVSILDSRNADINGFLASAAVSDVVLMYKPYGQSTWRYTETDQFPTLYSLPTGAATGPFRGIIDGSVTYGHTVTSQLNYLNMLLTFNRTDITGLVFEIPSVDKNGVRLFSSASQLSTTFLGQQNGGSYPCGNNGFSAGGSVKCIILNGQHSQAGVVTRIIMTEFTYVTQMNCRFVFVNPPTDNAYISVMVKAFGGVASASNPYGTQFIGQWQFNDIFQLNSAGSATSNTYTATSYRCPSQTPWRNNTQVYVFSQNSNIGSQRSSVAQLLYYDGSSAKVDDHFCEPTLGSTNNWDDLLFMTTSSGGVVKKYAYFVTTYQSTTSVAYTSTYGWRLKYLKCKYYANFNIKALFYFSDTSIQIATNSFSSSHCNGDTSGVSLPVLKYFSQSHYVNNGTPITYLMEYDLTDTINSISDFGFRSGDQMVLQIHFNNTFWGTVSQCDLLGGIISTSLTQQASCNVGSNSKFYITNIAGFNPTPDLASSTNYRVKISFLGGSVSNTANININFFTQLFANIDAYNSAYQPIFNKYNSLTGSGTLSSCYWETSSTCTLGDSSGQIGNFFVQKVTDTYLQVAISPSGNPNFATTAFQHNFVFTFNGFTYGTSCSVSALTFEFSSSSTPGSGYNNTFAATSTCAADYISITLSGRQFRTFWGSSVDNIFSSGQYIIFYITIAPNAATADLPNHQHDYVFVQGSYNYRNGGGWTTMTRKSVEYTPQTLAASATISTVSNSRGGPTEIQFSLSSLTTDLGPQNNNYLLLAEFLGSSGWTGSNDPFASYTNTALQSDYVDCKCIAGTSPLTISASSPIVDTVCKRRLPSGSFTNYAILIEASASANQDLICYIPEFTIASGMSFNVEFKLIFGDTYPPERISTTTKYTSRFRIQSNTLAFSGQVPNMNSTYVKGFSSSESPNFYASATEIGSSLSSTYTLSGSWNSVTSSLATPYLYINFQSAGPIPIYQFCSDTATFLECRVYTSRVYVVVAKLKASSTTSYSITNGGATLLYPPSQFSISSNFGAKIYVGIWNDRWYASSSLSRSQSSLAPISSNNFQVFSDLYGSKRAGYQTNLFFSINTNGQTLYNYAQTGSKMVISWSGLTTTENCQVWVDSQPLANLECTVASNSITIISHYFDYTTSNNIFVSMGFTHPNSASSTFNLHLYSEYSSSRNYLTISNSATLATDITYNSGTYSMISKSSVAMYPFQSRISTVANAPIRIRFKLPSSSVASANGKFTFSLSQIGYTTAHLCYIIQYASYASMMQQTQRTTYKVSCTSSSNVLTVVPTVTLAVGFSTYYELVMMPLNINSAGCTAGGCVTQSGYQQTNFDQASFIAYNHKTTPTIISQQVQKLYRYEGTSFLGLQQIYILCVQPRLTSLYLSINVNFTSSYNFPSHFLEVVLYDLSISAFPGFNQGDIVPCQLSSNFLSVSARQSPQCRVASTNRLNGYIKIRIQNIGFLSPQTYWVTLDDILLPTPTSSDNNNKFDVSVIYEGPSNLKYENYFPDIFQIDNTNTTNPVTSSSYTFNNPALTGFGNPVTGQITFNWPYDSSSSSYESKLAINFNGGYSQVWSDINTVTFVDTIGTYEILWINKQLNKFVFLLPNKGNGVSTTLNITSLNNPYPYQRELYNKNSTNVIINFYNNHFLQNSRTFNQPSFSIFTMNPSLIQINQNTPTNSLDNFNSIAPSSTNMLTLAILFDQSAVNIQARQLGTIQVRFTSGVSYIRECRVMRNNSQWVNTMSTCQPTFDGTYWNVYLYDVTNGQLTTGWNIQVFANFSSASLSYTSYVKASNNDVVEYQNSYSVSLSAYNSSRSIPSKLSWLDNRYVLFFHELQYRYLEAVSGQTTPYLRFRFRAVQGSSGYEDNIRIYLPDNLAQQPYTPVNNQNGLVVQFMPALSAGDRDFSVGFFGDGYLKVSGSAYYYDVYIRHGGGLTRWDDYMIQISQYDTATSNFYMSTTPNRQLVTLEYNYYPASSDYHYWQSFYIQSSAFFRSVELLHTTTTINDYETLTIHYKPQGSLTAGSSNRQIALRLSVEGRYHLGDGGVTSIYTAEGKTFINGNEYSGWVSNPNNNEMTSIKFGQYSIDNAPLVFSLTKQSDYSDNTAYTWIIPLIKNPSTAYISLRYNLTLVCNPTSGYEYTHNFYQSLNEYYTVADTSLSLATTITNNLRAVQTVSNVDLSVNIGSYNLEQWDSAIFKINNALKGIIPAISSPNDTSNYNYYFFKNIQMIMAQKKSTSILSTIGIGAASSSINYQSTFGLTWVRIFNNSNAPQATNPYTLRYSTPSTLTLTSLTSYTSTSLTLKEGYQSVGSTALYETSFSTPIISQGGQVRILFDKNMFSSEQRLACRAGSGFAVSSNDASALRCYRTSQGFRVAGFAAIAASTSAKVLFKLKSIAQVTSSAISADIYGIYEDNSTQISLAQVGTISTAASTVPVYLRKLQIITTPYWATLHTNNYYMIEGTFNLRDTTLLNGDYLYISQPGWTASGSRRLLIRQNSSTITGWTELWGYYVSTNRYRFQLPNNNLIQQQATIDTQYIFRYTTYYSSTSQYNGFIMGGVGVSRFYLQGYHSGYTETGYVDFVPYAEPFSMTITNRYPAAGRQTMLDMSFLVDVNLGTSSEVVFTFDTHNLLNDMFQNDLEGSGTGTTDTYRYLDCREWYTLTEVSNSRIVCLLYFGDRLANPPKPANLTIKFTQNFYGFSSSRTIRILVANVKNPVAQNLNTGVKVTINNYCENKFNLPCDAYEARGYYVTSANTENLITTATSFSSSSNLVLTTGLTHTFVLSLTASITTSDAIYIIYPENYAGLMPSNCAVTSYYCYVFPTRRWVVLIPTTTFSSGSRTISMTSMNNPYYAQPYSLNFKVTVARAGQVADVYYIEQPAFTPVSYSFVSTGTSTSLAVAATQTPSMYLRNYANTVIFTIGNIFSDSRVQAIYIKASTDVTVWDSTYCNASITGTSNFNYPLRFTCIVDPSDATFLRLTRDSDMTTYNPTWGQMSIQLHAKFTLADFPTTPILYTTTPVTSAPFTVYSSANATSPSSLYYMSQCSVTVSISQNQVPVISVINFNTQSFANRLARVNNKQVFYLLFKPLNPVTIGSVVFTIPSQFNYPGVFSLDYCRMIGRTTIQQNSCQLSRYQGQTLVTLTPTGYDNNVKIFQIGSVDTANWFTAPSLPGDFYEMNVAIYSPNGTLIAKQTRTISPVYGQNLDIPSIQIANVQDKLTTFATYDLTFITGNLQIPPGAATTATTQTSELQFIFENFNGMDPTNVFDNDLRTNLTTGSEIGCKIQSGLTALPGKRIKCLLVVGTSQTNKPTIRIVNYNFIDPQTTIIVSFAGIQTLPDTLVNTISIGAKIFYTDISSSTYLYIPTPIVTVPTNATNVLDNTHSDWINQWVVNSSFLGTNIVLQPTIFQISFKVPYYFRGIYGGLSSSNLTSYGAYTYSSTGAVDEFILMTFYPSTLLDRNNPVTVSCTTCTEVDIFYTSGMVRFRHSRSISGYNNYITFTFNNFPTSAYSILNQDFNISFQIFDQYQCIYAKDITNSIPRTVQKCTKFNFGVVSVSSLNGGQIGVKYTFSITTNHFVPSNGALSITLPSEYGNMVSNLATCTLKGFTGTNCYCRIATPNRIDIYANGTELSTTTTYSVQITGLQNPNIDSSNFVFIVTSYYEENIYLAHKICQNQIIPPTINIKPLRTCTLSWTPQYYNKGFNASYVFQLSCSDVFRGDSTLYIQLPSAFSATNVQGNIPCSSYQSTTLIQPTCTLGYVNNVFTLYTSIDASSQSSLSLLANLVNPINNTYSASAYVTSKGTQYASASKSSITILSNPYIIADVKNVHLLNTPKEAGLSSTYIFKISPVSGFTPSNLGITFPSNFYLDSSKLTIAMASTKLSNFFSYLTYNNIQALISNSSSVANTRISSYPRFTVSGTSAYLTNITNQVSATEWSYVFVSGVYNPSAYQYANFTIAYYLIASEFQALQWVYQHPLTYYISAPPQYIAINNVSVTDYDLVYPANYTFTFSSSNAQIALAGKNLSYIIVIPSSYKSVLWANSAPVCKFAELTTTSSCYTYQGEVIVTETFPTSHSSLTLTISTLLNPLLPTICDTTDTTILAQTFFIIRIIDTLSDSFLYESSSVVDGTNCLTFRAVRIPISLQYPLVMTAGLTYSITYGLSKAANNLKIKATVSNSGFTFSPDIVDFNDFYNLTKSTQLYLRSDISAGQYVINFQKSESSTVTYFRNILPVTVTVKAATEVSTLNAPTISIPTMQDSTVGNPVIVPLQFSIPSSTEMTMFLTISEETSSQTLAQYSPYLQKFSIQPRIINILPQTTAYSFVVNQGMRVVPPPLTLNFKITSNYPIVHQLTTPVMYLCFDRNPRFNVPFPPLRVKVTPFLSSCNQGDVGRAITNTQVSTSPSESSASLVNPKVISITVLSVASTGASIQISSLTAGKVYWFCIPIGYPAITSSSSIVSASNSNGISGVSTSQALTISSGSTGQVNYLATATISGLRQSQGYRFYAVSSSNLGQSEILSIQFNTSTLSNQVKMTLHFTSIVTVKELKDALKQVMRIAPSRINIETSIKTLEQQQSASTSIDNQLSFKYDIIILPDPNNDITSPLSIVQNFANSQSTLTTFQSYLPSFEVSKSVKYFERMPVLPIMIEPPKVSFIKLDQASFTIKFKALTTIYAVLYEQVGQGSSSLTVAQRKIQVRTVGSLPAAERALAPTSNQIVAGTDHTNTQLGQYKIFKKNTDSNGRGTISFSDLKEQSNYQVFITVATPRYSEPYLWPDQQIITFSFSTIQNPNVGTVEKQMKAAKELEKYDPKMAQAIQRHIELSTRKAETSYSSPRKNA